MFLTSKKITWDFGKSSTIFEIFSGYPVFNRGNHTYGPVVAASLRSRSHQGLLRQAHKLPWQGDLRYTASRCAQKKYNRTRLSLEIFFSVHFIAHIFQGFEEDTVFAEPLIYCHFAEGIGDPKYMPINNWKQLEKLLEDSLLNYNELVRNYKIPYSHPDWK